MNLATIILIFSIIAILCVAYAFYMGTVITARRWTNYIMDNCIRVDLLLHRIENTFQNAAAQAPEGAPVVIAQDSLLKLIDDILKMQNRGR